MFRIFQKRTDTQQSSPQSVYSVAVLALVAFATLAFTSAAHAQFRASLTGTVSDPQGAVVPGAQVTLKDNDTGKVLKIKSNDSGVYSFNALPPDHFTLSAVMPGFKSAMISNVTLTPETSNNLNLSLAVGDTSTSVDVNANSVPALATANADLTGVVTGNDIQHLPSAGRDIFQLAQLAPGSFGDGSQGAGGGSYGLPGTQGPGGSGNGQQNKGVFATENGPQTLSGGGQYETNSITVDGISTVSAVWGGTTVITPNADSVDSVKLTTNSYDAENGRFSGAQMQVTTKSGTNQIHGSAFFRAVRPGLNAYQRYNGPASLNSGSAASRGLVRDTSKYNDFGGSVGGPILKDRIFAFFAYETLRSKTQQVNNNWFETPTLDASAPAGYISNTYTNFAGHAPVGATLIAGANCGTAGLNEVAANGPVTCHTITGSGIDVGSPLTIGKGKQDPSYMSNTQPGVGNGFDGVADLAEYQTSTPFTVTQTQYNGRLDSDVTHKDHLAFAIYWVPNSQHFINGAARGYNQWNHNQINDAFSLIYNHTFSPTFLNEARANAAGWRWNEVTDNPQAPFGLPTDNLPTYGSIGTGGSQPVQPFGASGPSHLNQWTYGYKDVATKVLRNHTIKFGGDATQLHYLQDPVYAARPSYNFYNIWDFLNDAPYAESGQFNRFTGMPFSNRFDQREWIYGGFGQDDWKVTPSLTINFGVRYNYFDAIYAKQNNLPHVVFGTGAATFTGIQLVRGGKVWTPNKADIGPQFGFAWNPAIFNKRFVVRGGWGLNYNQEEFAISANASGNPNDAVTANFNNSTPAAVDPRIQYNIATSPTSLFGYPSNPNTITNYNAAGLPTSGSFNLTAYPNHLHTQQVNHYSLDLQADLGKQMVATLGYQGSSAHHLIFHQNAYIYGQYHGEAFNPATSYIEYYGDGGASNYNAMLVSLKHNMSHHFMASADYTWSKSMDDNSGPYEEDPYPYNPVYNRGRSDFNVGQALKIYGVYQPVFFHADHAWLEKIVGGWSISGIYNLHAGFPWTPVANFSTAAYYTGSGYSTLRPSAYNGHAGHNTSNSAFIARSGTPSSNFTGGGLAYFTKPVYTSVTFPATIVNYPTPGIARNSFQGPRYQDVDATLSKSFGLPKLPVLGDTAAFEFRADVFNLFNQTNLNGSSISNDISSANFGVAGSALGSRTVQLQARFSF